MYEVVYEPGTGENSFPGLKGNEENVSLVICSPLVFFFTSCLHFILSTVSNSFSMLRIILFTPDGNNMVDTSVKYDSFLGMIQEIEYKNKLC